MTMPSNDQRGRRGAGSRSGDDSRLIQIRFPERVTAFVALSMAAGAALVACALLLQIGGQELEAIGSLLVGSGIGIILAAFGGQATTRGKGFVLAGSAAIALVLTAFLEYRRDAGVSNAAELARARARDYSRGSISGVPEPPTAISLVFGNTIAGSSNINRRDLFSFVVFGNEINQAATASLKIEGPDEENEVISIGIPMSCIAAGIGSDLPFDWQLRRPENGPMEIIDRRDSDRVLGRWGLDVPPPCEEVRQAATPGVWTSRHAFWGCPMPMRRRETRLYRQLCRRRISTRSARTSSRTAPICVAPPATGCRPWNPSRCLPQSALRAIPMRRA
jgi:hypothetical protein